MPRTNPPQIDQPEILTPRQQADLAELDMIQAEERAVLEQMESLAKLMDAQFNIPGLPIPIGLDTIIGLIPGIGDTISLGVSGYIITRANMLGISQTRVMQMGLNTGIDWLIGLVPLIGDLFDVGWRGNLRNVALMRAELEDRWDHERAEVLRD